jgi:hypothetical protein
METLLSSENVFLYILIQFLLYFPSGYLVLNGRLKSIPFIVKLPIYVSFGLIITTIVLSLKAIIYIGSEDLVGFSIISYGLLMFRLYKSKWINSILSFLSSKKRLDYIVYYASGFTFIFIIIHFSLVGGHMGGWPPAGDAVTHGHLTSILLHNHRLQTTMAPIDYPWFEPVGLYVVTANLSLLFGLFPGAALFILATAIIILILLLIYSMVYILTRFIGFSIVALASCFYIYPGGNLEYWLIGYYYNGPYANLFGYLALIVFMACAFVIFDGYRKDIKSKLVVLISILGIGIIYTPLAILPVLYISSQYIFHLRHGFKGAIRFLHRFFYIPYFHKPEEKRERNISHRTSRNNISIKPRRMIIIGILLVLCIAFVITFERTGFYEIILTISKVVQIIDKLYTAYSLTQETVSTDFTNLILTFLTMLLAGISLIKRNRSNLSIFYLLYSGSILLSSWNITADYFWFFLSRRVFVLLVIFDWIVLLAYINDFVRWLANKISLMSFGKKYLKRINILHSSRTAVSLSLITIFFLSPLVSHLTFEQAELLGWFQTSDWFRNDYNLLLWISHNTSSTDLLMTDSSYTSRFINSFSLKNITSSLFFSYNNSSSAALAKDNAIAWDRPELFLKQFIDKYDVKYIVLVSDWSYTDPKGKGGDDLFHAKRITADQYKEIFNQMPFLKAVKEVGPSAVYKVVK